MRDERYSFVVATAASRRIDHVLSLASM